MVRSESCDLLGPAAKADRRCDHNTSVATSGCCAQADTSGSSVVRTMLPLSKFTNSLPCHAARQTHHIRKSFAAQSNTKPGKSCVCLRRNGLLFLFLLLLVL